MRSYHTHTLAALTLSVLLLTGCTVRSAPLSTAVPTAEESEAPAQSERYTVTYLSGESILYSETVESGGFSIAPDTLPSTAPFLGWTDEEGEGVSPEAVVITADRCFTACYGATLRSDVSYLRCEEGMFRGAQPLSRLECAELYFALLPTGETPALPTELPEREYPAQALCNTGMNAATLLYEAQNYGFASENPRTPALRQLCALCENALLPLTEGKGLCPTDAVSREELLSLLAPWFDEKALAVAAKGLSDFPTRLEVARMLNALLCREAEPDWRCADCESDEDMAVIAAACERSENGSGLCLLSDGSLCCFPEDGSLLRDGDYGSLHFDAQGLYSSGSSELDALVRALLVECVNPSDSYELQLRSAYRYLRDHFFYLKGDYYERGEHGWEEQEAIKLLTKGCGNCYSFAATLCAVFRAMGMEAHCISGLQGANYASHAWVWTQEADGVYFYDVEAEYAALRDGYSLNPMYRMGYLGSATQWLYVYDAAAEGIS